MVILLTSSSPVPTLHSVLSYLTPSTQPLTTFQFSLDVILCQTLPLLQSPFTSCRINSISLSDFTFYLNALKLITNASSTLLELITSYFSIVESLLDKLAHAIIKTSNRILANHWIIPDLLHLKTIRRHLVRDYHSTHFPLDFRILRASTNKYHKLISLAKSTYNSNLISS